MLNIGDKVVFICEPYNELVVTERINEHVVRTENDNTFVEVSETLFIKIDAK